MHRLLDTSVQHGTLVAALARVPEFRAIAGLSGVRQQFQACSRWSLRASEQPLNGNRKETVLEIDD